MFKLNKIAFFTLLALGGGFSHFSYADEKLDKDSVYPPSLYNSNQISCGNYVVKEMTYKESCTKGYKLVKYFVYGSRDKSGIRKLVKEENGDNALNLSKEEVNAFYSIKDTPEINSIKSRVLSKIRQSCSNSITLPSLDKSGMVSMGGRKIPLDAFINTNNDIATRFYANTTTKPSYVQREVDDRFCLVNCGKIVGALEELKPVTSLCPNVTLEEYRRTPENKRTGLTYTVQASLLSGIFNYKIKDITGYKTSFNNRLNRDEVNFVPTENNQEEVRRAFFYNRGNILNYFKKVNPVGYNNYVQNNETSFLATPKQCENFTFLSSRKPNIQRFDITTTEAIGTQCRLETGYSKRKITQPESHITINGNKLKSFRDINLLKYNNLGRPIILAPNISNDLIDFIKKMKPKDRADLCSGNSCSTLEDVSASVGAGGSSVYFMLQYFGYDYLPLFTQLRPNSSDIGNKVNSNDYWKINSARNNLQTTIDFASKRNDEKIGKINNIIFQFENFVSGVNNATVAENERKKYYPNFVGKVVYLKNPFLEEGDGSTNAARNTGNGEVNTNIKDNIFAFSTQTIQPENAYIQCKDIRSSQDKLVFLNDQTGGLDALQVKPYNECLPKNKADFVKKLYAKIYDYSVLHQNQPKLVDKNAMVGRRIDQNVAYLDWNNDKQEIFKSLVGNNYGYEKLNTSSIDSLISQINSTNIPNRGDIVTKLGYLKKKSLTQGEYNQLINLQVGSTNSSINNLWVNSVKPYKDEFIKDLVLLDGRYYYALKMTPTDFNNLLGSNTINSFKGNKYFEFFRQIVDRQAKRKKVVTEGQKPHKKFKVNISDGYVSGLDPQSNGYACLTNSCLLGINSVTNGNVSVTDDFDDYVPLKYELMLNDMGENRYGNYTVFRKDAYNPVGATYTENGRTKRGLPFLLIYPNPLNPIVSIGDNGIFPSSKVVEGNRQNNKANIERGTLVPLKYNVFVSVQ